MRFAPRIACPVVAGLLAFGFGPKLRADWKDDVDATRLAATFSGVPTSAGILTQVEASATTATPADNYLPNAANAAFAGTTIVNKSPGSGTSGHATSVGLSYYGSTGSLLPATPTVHAYNASYWIEPNFLRFNTTSAPLVESARVQNHSWISTTGLTAAQIAEIGQRLDFAVERDGFICVAGVNNGQSTTLPLLLAQAYNLVTVGLTYGGHSAGFTAYDGAGRIKPDIVAPDTLTSFATPKVASAAGVLAARATASPHSLAGANVPRVVKALLLAGATKEEFPAWARTTARPLDLRYGAGELNVLLSYRTLESGRAAPSTSALVAESGWAAASVASGTQHTYFFEVPTGAAPAPFSVALTWHRLVEDGIPGPLVWSPSAQALVNLDLALHQASDFALGPQLDLSASTVDNVEHIYAAALAPGRYALVVASPSGAASTAYALAWRSTPTATVEASVAEARELDGAPGEFTIARTGSTATPLLVPLTVGGDAIAGAHYTALPTSVVIPAGASSVTVAVAPVGDDLAQGDRTVTLAVAGDHTVAAGGGAPAVVVLRDKPFDAWRFQVFDAAQLENAAISGDMADPDADGLPNLLEYALGGAPLVADAGAVMPVAGMTEDTETGARYPTLTYLHATGCTDLAYAVEWTPDLAESWQSGVGVVEELTRVPVEGGEAVTVRATADVAEQMRQFLRLRVTRL